MRPNAFELRDFAVEQPELAKVRPGEVGRPSTASRPVLSWYERDMPRAGERGEAYLAEPRCPACLCEQVSREGGRRCPARCWCHHDRLCWDLLRRGLLRQQGGLGEELLAGGKCGPRRATARPEQLSQRLAREQRRHV